MFTYQIDGFYNKELKAYRFFVPKQYQQDPEKESEVRDKDNEKNIITFQVKDPVPIDHLDKMPDKDKDLKMLCDSVADDFLKNLGNQMDQPRKLIRSRPYVRK